jgi:hypothetical protein
VKNKGLERETLLGGRKKNITSRLCPLVLLVVVVELVVVVVVVVLVVVVVET